MSHMTSHPTEPGPFQKYLFSGACYVSIGQCYARLVELLERDAVPADLAELQSRLVAVWLEAFDRQMALAGGLLEDPRVSRQPGLEEAVRVFREQVLDTGGEAMDTFLRTLAADRGSIPAFPEFFRSWAEACDGAYDRLVRSAAFAEIIGLVANVCIDLAVEGRDP